MPAGLKKELLVILNDNQMSICPRVGGMARLFGQVADEPILIRA